MESADSSAYLKRLACTVAAQMPDDREEAFAVLRYVREILLNLGEEGWSSPSISAPTLLRQPTDRAKLQVVDQGARPARQDIANRD